MKRYILFIVCIFFSFTCFSNNNIKETELKMNAAEQTPDNIMAYLATMPDIVKTLEYIGVEDSDYVIALIRAGLYYYITFNSELALEHFNKAEKILEKHAYIKNKIPEEDLSVLKEAKMRLETKNFYQEGDEKVSLLFNNKKYNEVLAEVKPYLKARCELVHNVYTSTSEKMRYNWSKMVSDDINWHYFMSAIYHTKNFEYTADAYNYILFYKQLQLRTTLQVKEEIIKSNNNTILEYYKEYRQLEKDFAQSNPPTHINKDSLLKKMEKLGSLLTLESKLSYQNEIITWKDIQSKLYEWEAAVEFFEFYLFEDDTVTETYGAFVITSWCKSPFFILLPNKQSLTYFETQHPSDLYNVNKYGAAMGQLYWLDLLLFFNKSNISNVYFSPDGLLHNFAIESLPYSQEYPTSYYLNLVRLSSTRELLNIRKNTPLESAALYGDLAYRLSYEGMQKSSNTRGSIQPIPGTKQEIDSIKSILASTLNKIEIFSKEKGTEKSVKMLDGNSPTILHFATHGFVNDNENNENPMDNTGLIMSYGARKWEGKDIPNNVEDGILTAAEIETLDLSNTEVVVLSACNTALGDVTAEGVWGLQRAFKKAGVETVVMSLWQIDDEATAVLMEYFYEEIIKSYNALVRSKYYIQFALQTAQIRMSKHPKYSDPYYWAGFIAID